MQSDARGKEKGEEETGNRRRRNAGAGADTVATTRDRAVRVRGVQEPTRVVLLVDQMV